MKKFSLIIFLFVFATHALPEGLKVLETQAVMHCIKAGDRDWLNGSLSNATGFRVGLIHDRESYPSKDHIIVVVFETDSKGQVFDLTAECKNKQCVYTIVNNGSFMLNKSHLEFLDPPLGGVWTQEYLEANIRKITNARRTWVNLSTISAPLPEVSCTSYVQNTQSKAEPHK
jgi:hypothetical protein